MKSEDNFLAHIGTPHVGMIPHSGRYEYGSGEKPNQHSSENLVEADMRLRKQGLSETERAKELGLTTTSLRRELSRIKNEEKAAQLKRVLDLRAHGYSVSSIVNMTHLPERTVYDWLTEEKQEKMGKTQKLANNLKDIVDSKEYVDVGSGTEYMLGTNKNALNQALNLLENEGYSVLTVKTPNVTDPSKFTNVKVLCKPGTTWGYIQNHQELIKPFEDYSTDGGVTIQKVEYPPASISSDRVKIQYADMTPSGNDCDGVMYIRRNVPDLDLGKSNYAQVRIAVDGTHYLKGMAIYSDDMPDGCDILFNTNKTSDVPKMKVLKPLKDSEELPFGAVISAKGQSYYEDKNGEYVQTAPDIFKKATSKTSADEKRYSLSAINKLKEEGDWNEYSKTLSSQMLSKQSKTLVKRQLELTLNEKKEEFEEIKNLTQPEIKKKLLLEFASDCDASAVDLKATALPGQTTKVILPLRSIKDTEVYAPGYENGTKVALIRYPHAGIFEIPVLTVNNNNQDAKKILGNAPIDAIGITSKVAEKLSGADFDGDTAVVIPLSDKVNILSSPQLESLKGFDPKKEYKGYEGMKVMTARQKGMEMGMVSNLITDMTLQGAKPEELARAVKHSMVVIDAQKHELNWKLSEEQNGIAALRMTYQGKARGGASTLISRASSQALDENGERKQFNPNRDIDKETGEIVYRYSGRTYEEYTKVKENGKVLETVNEYGKKVPVYKTDENGNLISKTRVAKTETTKMDLHKDAFELSSGTPIESLYATHANGLKALANQARLEYLHTESTKVNQSARQTYSPEVESLTNKLKLAVLNSPKERQAQLEASTKVKAIMKTTNMTDEELKKLRQTELSQARAKYGANKKDVQIDISDREWEAIMNGAFSSSTLSQILSNTDADALKKRATPKGDNNKLSATQISLIKSRVNSGFTIDEIAKSLGVSASTVSKYIKE